VSMSITAIFRQLTSLQKADSSPAIDGVVYSDGKSATPLSSDLPPCVGELTCGGRVWRGVERETRRYQWGFPCYTSS